MGFFRHRVFVCIYTSIFELELDDGLVKRSFLKLFIRFINILHQLGCTFDMCYYAVVLYTIIACSNMLDCLQLLLQHVACKIIACDNCT